MSGTNKASTNEKTEISVIIPMHNAEETISDCLNSIFLNQGVDFEVIVVDDASTDNSLTIAREFNCTIISLTSNIKSANCRNLGACHANSEIIIFFDSDQIMMPFTLSRFWEALCLHPEVDAVVGSFSATTPILNFVSRFKNLRHHYVHQDSKPEGATLASGMMAIRKSTFDRYGGFEPSFQPASIEDIALGYKLHRNNHRIQFCKDIQVIHLKKYTLKSLLISDIFHRAIPWTELMIRDRIVNNDLNTKSSNVTSVFLSWFGLIWFTVPGFHLTKLMGIACILLIWFLNYGLLKKSYSVYGLKFLIQALFFVPLMYFYQGIGLLAGIICYLFGLSLVEKKAPMHEPDYVIYPGGSH